jgi:hypothetical protein
MLDEVLKMGFYSAWNDIKADVQAYQGTEMLVVADLDEKYGENWFICLTEEAKEALFFEAKAAERAAEEEKLRAEEAERRRLEEELAIERIVVTEQPLFARPYASASALESEEAVRAAPEEPRASRALLSVRVQRRRYTFGARVTFHDRNSDALLCDLRPRREPLYDHRIKVATLGVQAGASALSGKADGAAQTSFGAPANYGVQCAMDHDFDAVAAGRAPALRMDRLDSAVGDAGAVAARQAAEAAREQAAERAAAAGAAAPSAATAAATAAAAEAFAAHGDTGGDDDGEAYMSNADLQTALAEGVALAAFLESGGAEPSHRGGGLGGGGGGGGGAAARKMRDKDSALGKLVEFAQRVLPQLEHSLSQNETLNIYMADLGSGGAGGDGGQGGDADGAGGKGLREERQFMDLELSQNKGLPAVEWHPKNGSWLAVAAAPRLSLEQRAAGSSMPRTSHVLLYTLGEFVSQIVLEVPSDVTSLAWNKSNANLLVCGCVSGQVCLFDMTAANAQLAAAASSAGADKNDAADDGAPAPEARAPRVAPRFVSSVEGSHARPVVSVKWLPLSHHLTPRGALAEEKEAAWPQQFMSIAADGMFAVWDTRFRERELARLGAKAGGAAKKPPPRGKAGAAAAAAEDGPEMLETPLVPGATAVAAPPPDVLWLPAYKVLLKLGVQPFAACAVCWPPDAHPADPLLLGSEGGLLAAADWAPVGEGTHRDVWARMEEAGSAPAKGGKGGGDDDDDKPSGGGGGGGGGAGRDGGSRMLWVSREADRPAVCVRRHPSVAGVFLVVTDFSFAIWRTGTAGALFVSATAPAAYTVGMWSPSRPAVVVLGRADGAVDCWDLLDSTAKPSVSFALVSVPITSLQFRTQYTTAAGQKDKQLAAVGDSKGSLHILAVPPALKRGPASEAAQLAALLDREAARSAYGAARAGVQEAEKAKKAARAAAAQAAKEALQQKQEAELQAAKAALVEKDPAAASRLDFAALEARKQAAARAAAEAAFRQLQDAVMNELKVSEDEIVPLAALAAREAAALDKAAAGGGASGTVSQGSSATATPAETRKPSVADAGAAAAKAAAAAAAPASRGSKAAPAGKR